MGLTVLLKKLNGETLEHGKWLANNGGSLGILGSESLGRGLQCREKTGTERTRKRGGLRAEGGHSAPGGLSPQMRVAEVMETQHPSLGS